MFKKVVTIASMTAVLATATVPAFAYDRGHRGHGGGHHGGGGNGAAVALGVLGAFAVGAAILSSTQRAAEPPVVYAPPPPVAYAPAPGYNPYYPPQAYYQPQPQYQPQYQPAPAYYGQAPAYYGNADQANMAYWGNTNPAYYGSSHPGVDVRN